MIYKVTAITSNLDNREQSFTIKVGYDSESLIHGSLPDLDIAILPDEVYLCLRKWVDRRKLK